MASGKEVGAENVLKFDEWAASQTNQDFLELMYRGTLNKTKIANIVGFNRKAWRDNPTLVARLETLSKRLQKKGILPKKVEDAELVSAHEDSSGLFEKESNKSRAEAAQLNKLEEENLQLKARIKYLEGVIEEINEQNDKLTELRDVLADLGTNF